LQICRPDPSVATGAAVTEFPIQKPEGWPAGDYRVDILVSGTTATVSKAFKVM